MRLGYSFALLWLACGPLALGETALTALRALPKGEAAKVVSIEGTEGSGEPLQWRISVRETKGARQLREYIVASGEVVSSREVAPPEETVPLATFSRTEIKIDSDEAAALARQETGLRGAAPAGLRLQLQKQSAKAVPIWLATRMEADGREAGWVALTASRGNVVGREGLERAQLPPKAVEAPKVDPQVTERDRAFLAEAERGAPDATEIAPPLEPVAPALGAQSSEIAAAAALSSPAPQDRPEEGTLERPASRERAVSDRESVPETQEEKAPRTAKDHRERSRDVSISPVREAARVTRPVRRIIHRALPF